MGGEIEGWPPWVFDFGFYTGLRKTGPGSQPTCTSFIAGNLPEYCRSGTFLVHPVGILPEVFHFPISMNSLGAKL